MERPKKEDYDFNDPFEAIKYIKELHKYIDKIENIMLGSDTDRTICDGDSVYFANCKYWTMQAKGCNGCIKTYSQT